MALAISVNVYQVDVAKKPSPQVQGFTTSRIGNIWTTASGSTIYDNKVDSSVYQIVNTGFDYYGGAFDKSKRIYYTSDTVAALIAKINA